SANYTFTALSADPSVAHAAGHRAGHETALAASARSRRYAGGRRRFTARPPASPAGVADPDTTRTAPPSRRRAGTGNAEDEPQPWRGVTRAIVLAGRQTVKNFDTRAAQPRRRPCLQ